MSIRICWILSVLWAWSVCASPTELLFWHAMAGNGAEELLKITDDFNRSQSAYHVNPVYKGNYIETFTSYAAAFRAHRAPALVQIFEVGTGLMSSPAGIIKPVDELLSEYGYSVQKNDFFPVVRDYYSRNGHLLALPFNLSIPVIYYNRDALHKLGYKDDAFPTTWNDFEQLAEKLLKSGYQCAYTSTYPGWILFESFLAIHGLNLILDHPLRAAFSSPDLLNHLKRLKRWRERHYFRYAGRTDDAVILFSSGVCPIMSQSSGSYNSLVKMVAFPLGMASMPLDEQIRKQRHANVIGGAALWVTAGQSKHVYKGIAQFLAFVATPSIQKRWHLNTGYIPLGIQGSYADIFTSSTHPIMSLVNQNVIHVQAQTEQNVLGPQNQIRAINDEVLEEYFTGAIQAEELLKQASKRINHTLHRYEKNTQLEK